MDRLLRALVTSGVAIAFVLAATCGGSRAPAQGAAAKFDPAVRSEFKEPVTLASKDGVLEVTLTAHQGHAKLDTVAGPAQNFLVFAYHVVRGTASNGEMSADNLYPAPTLQVFPGESLIVHLDNVLTGLTIRDYYNPQYSANGEKVLLYPEQMTSSPVNLHVHGVHVSPKGNSDNVMLHIPPGMSNTYTYQTPKTCRRRLLVPQPSPYPHHVADLLRLGPSPGDRAHRREPSAGDGQAHPDPQHGAAIQTPSSIGWAVSPNSTTSIGRKMSAR